VVVDGGDVVVVDGVVSGVWLAGAFNFDGLVPVGRVTPPMGLA
jgi:hypothetical protein